MSEVLLLIYDLSNGLAAQISLQLTGRLFKAIHHTSVVFRGREYFFGRFGIESSLPEQSPYGVPIERRSMGMSQVDQGQWQNFLKGCEDAYGIGKYHLLEHNCNTFSNAALQFLIDRSLDPEILSLPKDFLGTPLGVLLRPQIDAMYNVRAEPAISSEILTSPSNTDRTGEAYRFMACPTLAKLFGSIKGEGLNLGSDELERRHLRECAEQLLSGALDCQKQAATLGNYLIGYFENGVAKNVYPGLDIVRVMIGYKPFTDFLRTEAGSQLLYNITDLHFEAESECTASLCAYLKLLCNAFSTWEIRSDVVTLLQSRDKLDIVTNAALSSEVKIAELGLQTIWNYLISEGVEENDDFAIASLAAVAECEHLEHESIASLRRKILSEIMGRNSQAIQEMIEILDLQ